ncbi:MAG TPA: T9SS type A sorting domain-containing protein [Bacteroidia bacterium]
MKRGVVFLAFMSLVTVKLYSQNFQWAKQLAGSSGFTVDAKAVISNDNGDVFVAGSFSGTVDFDPGPGTHTVTAQGTDGFVGKYDAGGNLQWVYTTNASGNQDIPAITINPGATPKLNCVVQIGTSAFYLLALDGTDGSVFTNSANFTSTGTVKINAVNRTYSGTTGDYHIVGSFSGTLTVGSVTVTSAGQTDGFCAKFRSTSTAPANWFTFSWAKTYGGTANDEVNDVNVNSMDFNPVIVGSFEGTADFDPTAGSNTLTSGGLKDGFIAYLDGNNGNLNTLATVPVEKLGSTGNDAVLSIYNPGGSDYYIGGYFNGTVNFDLSGGTNNMVSSGAADGFIAKYSLTTGTAQNFPLSWKQKFGGVNDDEISDITCSSSSSTVYYSAIAGNASGSGIIIAAYTAAGTNVTFGGPFLPNNTTSYHKSHGITVNSLGDVYSCGIFNGATVDFDPNGTSSANLTANGTGNNGYLHKMSTCISAITPTITASSNNICSATGGSVTLSIPNAALNGNNTWNWYSGSCGGTAVGTGTSVTITPTSTADYYVRAEGGCASTSSCSPVKTVSVTTTPTVMMTATSFTLCSGSSTTLTALGANDYLWSTGATTNTISVSPNSTTSYTVTGTNNGCSASVSETVQVTPTLSAPTDLTPAVNLSICAGNSTTLTVNNDGSIIWFDTPAGPNQVGVGASITTATLTASTTYYVSAGNTCGTSPRTAITVTVTPIPTVVGNDVTICENQTADLEAAPSAGTVHWFSGPNGGTEIANGVIYTTPQLITSTPFYVEAQDNGCISTPRHTITVTVNPMPDISINDLGSALESNESMATSYQWLNCNLGYTPINGETNSTFAPVMNGDYAVAVNLNGCIDTSSCYNVNSIGFNLPGKNTDINVYPNPNHTGIYVIALPEIESVDYSLIALTGKVIATGKLNKDSNTVDVSNESAGIYLLEIKNETGRKQYKLVKTN